VTAFPLNDAVRGWFILAIGKYLLQTHREVELKPFKIDTESTAYIFISVQIAVSKIIYKVLTFENVWKSIRKKT